MPRKVTPRKLKLKKDPLNGLDPINVLNYLTGKTTVLKLPPAMAKAQGKAQRAPLGEISSTDKFMQEMQMQPGTLAGKKRHFNLDGPEGIALFELVDQGMIKKGVQPKDAYTMAPIFQEFSLDQFRQAMYRALKRRAEYGPPKQEPANDDDLGTGKWDLDNNDDLVAFEAEIAGEPPGDVADTNPYWLNSREFMPIVLESNYTDLGSVQTEAFKLLLPSGIATNRDDDVMLRISGCGKYLVLNVLWPMVMSDPNEITEYEDALKEELGDRGYYNYEQAHATSLAKLQNLNPNDRNIWSTAKIPLQINCSKQTSHIKHMFMHHSSSNSNILAVFLRAESSYNHFNITSKNRYIGGNKGKKRKEK